MKKRTIDEVLTELVQPIGIWQIGVVIMAALSMPNTAILSVFFNTYPKHRCRVESELENWFSIMAANFSSWNFENASQLISPAPVNDSSFSASCEMYSIPTGNHTVDQYIQLYTNASEIIKCTNGYVYDYANYQYQGGLVQEWDLVCDAAWQVPFNESAYMGGMLVGFIVGGWCSDRLGRRRTFLIAALFEFLTNLILQFSPNHIVYIILRILVAFFLVARFSAFTVLMNEITTPKYRTSLSAISSCIQLGFQRMILALLAFYFQEWRVLNWFCIGSVNLSIFCAIILPESPKWLAARGDYLLAGKVLYRGYKINHTCKQTSIISEHVFLTSIGFMSDQKDENVSTRIKQPNISMLHLFNRKMFRTTLIAILLMTGQITCTIGILFYAGNIRQHISIVIVCNALSTLPGLFLASILYRVFRYRKRPLAAVLLGASLCLWFIALYTVLAQPPTDILLNVFANIVIFGLMTSQNMLFVFVPELYSPLYRTQGFGLSSGLARIGTLFFPLINRLDLSVMHGFPLVIYAGIITLYLVILAFLHDTNGEVKEDKEEHKEKIEMNSPISLKLDFPSDTSLVNISTSNVSHT